MTNQQAHDPQTHYNLYKFLAARGWRNENYLKVGSFKDTGRGLYAKRDLLANDEIIELPIDCMISILTLGNDEEFNELFDQDKIEEFKGQVSFQALLAFYLSYQKSMEDSPWINYIETLPESFSTPYFCKKSELYHLPDHLLRMIVDQNKTIKTQFELLSKLLNEPSKISLDTFKWSYFVCNSRSVFINSKILEPLVDSELFKELLSDDPNMALAPMLDLLNHSDRVQSQCQLSHSAAFIEMNAHKFKSKECKLTYQLINKNSFKKFDQIFINYGNHNNTKLLLEYGFIIRNNQMDFLEFSLDDVNNYIKNHLVLRHMVVPKHKYKFIRDHNLDSQLYIDINDGLNHNFKAILAILLLPQNLYNLTQVAFGDELDFNDVREHAVEIVLNKKKEIEKLYKALEKEEELSQSALMCLEYFKECILLIDRVVEFL
jgi:ATP-binding cassette subfamily B (MDR/TAP) protein 7